MWSGREAVFCGCFQFLFSLVEMKHLWCSVDSSVRVCVRVHICVCVVYR
jgi:hypothetical protein